MMTLKNELLAMSSDQLLCYIIDQADKGFVIWGDIEIVENRKHHKRKGVLAKCDEQLSFFLDVNTNDTINNNKENDWNISIIIE